MIAIHGWWDSNGNRHEEVKVLTLLADGYRDESYLDWLLANKFDEESTTEEFNDLMKYIHEKRSKGFEGMALLAGKMNFNYNTN